MGGVVFFIQLTYTPSRQKRIKGVSDPRYSVTKPNRHKNARQGVYKGRYIVKNVQKSL